MTVAELIERLSTLDQTLNVVIRDYDPRPERQGCSHGPMCFTQEGDSLFLESRVDRYNRTWDYTHNKARKFDD